MTDPIPGQLHLVSPKPLTAFEFGPPTSSSSTPLVLFIAGLNNTLCSVPYLPLLSERLSRAGWRLAQVCLTRRGCQDAIAYAHLRSCNSANLAPLDGIILQAPVSDRERPSIAPLVSTTSHLLTEADLDLDAFVPPSWSSLFGTSAGVTYRRWMSLALPAPLYEVKLDESEDFFSSDLSDTRLTNVLGAVDCPLLIVLSGRDETYPEDVKAHLPALLERFRGGAARAVGLCRVRRMI